MKKVHLILLLYYLSNVAIFAFEKKLTTDTINIYPNHIICNNFIGVGVQWSAYPHADSEDSEWGFLMTEKKWDILYKRLDYMQPRFMRVMDQANWRYFEKLDENGNAILNFDNQKIKSLFKILDYCQKNNITVMIGEWGVPGHKHDKDNPDIHLRDASDKRWINMIADWIDFLINKKGYTCIKYYDFINEPNGNWACTEGDFSEWALGVKLLHEEFEKRGLDKVIKNAGPGSVPNYTSPKFKDKYQGEMWINYASEVLGDELGAYDTHAYFPHSVIREGKAAEYMFLEKDVKIADEQHKPFFLGEIGLKSTKDKGALDEENEKRRLADGNTSTDCNMFVYDYFYGVDIASAAIQSLLAGVDGMAVWSLDDAMHTKDDLADKTQIKRWGFWNILGTELYNKPEDENIRPWYYAWSWLCRFMPQNSLLIKSEQPKNKGCQILVSKYKTDLTIFLVNTSESNEKVFLIDSEEAPSTFNQLVYNEKYIKNENPFYSVQLKKVNMKKGLSIVVPAKTFMVLTTMKD